MVTAGLLLANLSVFLVELALGGEVDALVRRWGLIPADVLAGILGQDGEGPASLVTLVTTTFLHAGWLHVLVNLLYLGVFGVAVEARVGAGRFLALYLASGLGGSLVHVALQPHSSAPAIGASGAIAGVIAAHLVLFPGATLGSLAPALFFQRAANLPALLLLLLWLVTQLLSGVASITSSSGQAWGAHLGGFAFGFALTLVLRPPHWRRGVKQDDLRKTTNW